MNPWSHDFDIQRPTDDDGDDNVVTANEVTAKTRDMLRLASEMCTGDYYTMTLRPRLKDAFRGLGHDDDDDDIGGFIHSIVCYGLGNFTHSYISAYQLALLLCLREELLNRTELVDRYVYLFDPNFTAIERSVLVDGLGLRLIEVNEQCRRTADGPTCFFMPHCDRHFYENLLEANVSQFERGITDVVLIGNSLQSYSWMMPNGLYQARYPLLARCVDFLDEYPLCNNYAPHSNVFNNTSIHAFRQWRTRVD